MSAEEVTGYIDDGDDGSPGTPVQVLPPKGGRGVGGSSLAERMAAVREADPDEGLDLDQIDDDDGEATGSSEDDDVGDDGGEDQDDEDVTSDEEGDDEAPPTKTNDSYGKLASNLVRSQREVQDLRKANAQLQEEVRRRAEAGNRSGPSLDEHEDHEDSVVALLARRLGCEEGDPRVEQLMAEVAADLTLRALGDRADASEVLRARKEERSKQRAEAARWKELTDWQRQRDEDDRRSKMEQELASHRSSALQEVRTVIDSTKLPHMLGGLEAEGLDPYEYVTDSVLQAIRDGVVPAPTTDREGRELVLTAARNIEAHYRKIAERLAKGPGPRIATTVDGKGKDPARQKSSAAKRPRSSSVTGSGGTGRPRQAAQQQGTTSTGRRTTVEGERPRTLTERITQRRELEAQTRRRGR